MKIMFSADKPKSCEYCYFWNSRKKKCKFDDCYYLIKKCAPAKNTVCTGCPYGRTRPCIGWCTRVVIGQISEGEF